jgi:beta-glucosidase
MPGAAADRPHLDVSLGAEERIGRLVEAMTLEERVAQCGALWLAEDDDAHRRVVEASTSPDPVRALDLAETLRDGVGQLTRPYGSGPLAVHRTARVVDAIQRHLVEHTRLGIPALVHEECLTGLMAPGATVMPGPLAWGATFDPDSVEAMARAVASQMARLGVRLGLAPVLDVVRDHRWGRVEECISEDPYLVGTMGAAFVAGLQATGAVGATLKHFCGHGSPVGGHNTGPVHAGARELTDVFALPFEMVIKRSGAAAVMSAYHDLDGVPCSVDRSLLTERLRDRWGFEGLVVSDYWALNFLGHEHGVAGSPAEAAREALHAGVDVELPRLDHFRSLADEVRAGRVPEEEVVAACRRVLGTKLRLGLFENPYVDHRPIRLDNDASRRAARRLAEASVTLLANDGTLPLDPEIGRMAVVGPLADDGAALCGNYSFVNHVAYRFTDDEASSATPSIPSVLDALRAELPAVDVTHVPGCSVTGDATNGVLEAVECARAADVCIAVVGDRAGHLGRGTVGEGTDRDDLSLPGRQAVLLRALASTRRPLVVVDIAGRPHDLSGILPVAGALLVAWFPGQEGADAIAGVLTGRVEPAGRTPVSFTRGAGQQPFWYGSPTLARQAYLDAPSEPVFPFGHGLSYTSFSYAGLEVPAIVDTTGRCPIRCAVTNVGDRRGEEVVQLYVHDPIAEVVRPRSQLCGYARVPLEPGETAEVSFDLPLALVGYTGRDGRRRVDPGDLVIGIGSSSRDLPLVAAIAVTGTAVEVGEDRPLVCPVKVSFTSGTA